MFNNLSYFYEELAKLKLLKRKGLYPYDYMDCFERLSETTLPPIESFYSELNKSGISEDNYTHAQKVWETFEMETLQDFITSFISKLMYSYLLTFSRILEMFVKKIMDLIQLGTIQLQVLHGMQL